MQSVTLKQKKSDYRTKEAYRTLRTNIEFSGKDIKVICITSSIPGEGKTTVAYDLAEAFAQNGKNTLLIDADLRKSVMRSRYFDTPVQNGLSNFLVGKADVNESICKTNIEYLDILSTGHVPPNPSELLGGPNFAALIKEVRDKYDMIIIDTPPLGSVIDTAVITRQCDGSIIVIEAGKMGYHFVRKVQKQLEIAESKILGCVLTKAKVSTKGYYGKYYGKYYGSYYGAEGTE